MSLHHLVKYFFIYFIFTDILMLEKDLQAEACTTVNDSSQLGVAMWFRFNGMFDHYFIIVKQELSSSRDRRPFRHNGAETT